jgi:hypothetical protein
MALRLNRNIVLKPAWRVSYLSLLGFQERVLLLGEQAVYLLASLLL